MHCGWRPVCHRGQPSLQEHRGHRLAPIGAQGAAWTGHWTARGVQGKTEGLSGAPATFEKQQQQPPGATVDMAGAKHWEPGAPHVIVVGHAIPRRAKQPEA